MYVDNGRIVVTNCGKHRTRVGIDAPPEVRIDRKEVHLLRTREQSDPDYTRPEKGS